MEIIKSVFRNVKIRIVSAVCASLCAVILVQTVVTLSFSDDTEITEAFATSDGIMISDREVEATAKLSFKKDNFYPESEKFLDAVNRALELDNVSYEKDDEKICIKFNAASDNYAVSGVVTWSEELQNTYFHCVVGVNENVSDISAVKKILDTVLDKQGTENITYIRINAEKKGVMDKKECKEYVGKVFNRIDAKEVYNGNDGVYVAYGYSKKLTDTITANDKLINVQVSLSYNEAKDLMEISLGYPIINTSY